MTTMEKQAPARLTVRARVLLSIALVILVGLTVQRLWLARGERVIHEFAGATMGTTYSVTVEASSFSDSMRALVADTIRDRLDEINRLMSTYDPGSELSRFNQHLSTAPFPLSEPTMLVFTVAQEISEQTGGAFDVTVAPLVDAWGFGPVDPPTIAPEDTAINRLLARVGYEKIEPTNGCGSVSGREGLRG